MSADSTACEVRYEPAKAQATVGLAVWRCHLVRLPAVMPCDRGVW
ncbi:hypothetical protein DIQ79_31755 [Mycolicibacterium smegmatis]|uniref:Uncharacterized protein n=1 Tax=Mycolicibacterium smegmatis (strain ATCC 700084 / mc(2)155) TaxID=246196 RepID=A0QZK2_MYCS2|nr:hypothetical protein MSMEG_4054 [Mycolicibacterium smegmatis MC2 155]TBM37511.1 hypothetical protein DIQ86_30040 [Mycolicibacterium smegmatis]TBH27054.1 hypothetical protein EYS45_31655 [Mycolicibacterium smegmatis MC2 155]TBM44162.1 hypothetical protein DIQ85_31705 [Mycolicibacterium smegmatis]TBM54059.1 hypothetical protein DIQ83_32005 [Mycolicibacterium smegmatis]